MTAGTVTTAGPSPMPRVPRVLSIAGTDPTGGAGIQADLKSIAAHDGYGMAVVTALVAQNTRGVRSVHVPDSAFLGEQLDAVWDDVTVDAVKTGMLGTAEVVRVVVDGLRRHRPRWLVVDPVMVATSGDRLLDRDAEAAMVDLFALADLVTPNRDELRVLADLAGSDATDPLDAALAVARHFDVRVLAKGGHDGGPTSDDALVTPDGSVRVFTGPRVATENTHGTGCSLSSAIATTVARHGDWEARRRHRQDVAHRGTPRGGRARGRTGSRTRRPQRRRACCTADAAGDRRVVDRCHGGARRHPRVHVPPGPRRRHARRRGLRRVPRAGRALPPRVRAAPPGGRSGVDG